MHCSRVFRSSAPSDLLPSSPCGRPSGTAQGEYGGTRSMEWGVGPGGGVPHRGCCPAGKSPARHIPEGTLPGPVRSRGRVTQCVIQRPQASLQQVPPQPGPLQSGPLQVTMTGPAPEGTREYPSSALPGAPVALGRGRPTPDQARDLAGRNSGELPGQAAEQLASWPPGMPSADQPPASALRRRAALSHRKST